jgi:hypothetical protein
MCIRHSPLPIIMTAHRDTHVNRNFLASILLLTLSSCAAAPGPTVQDKLDAQTGSTVSVLPEPVELLTSTYFGVKTGTFAYLGPFETDQMGTRTLFLWVLVPHDVSSTVVPVIHCDDAPVTLPRQSGSLRVMGLAQPPYDPPDPWGAQWYFALDDATLACFAHAHRISVDIPNAHGDLVTFTVESTKNTTGFPVLATFAARRGTKGL